MIGYELSGVFIVFITIRESPFISITPAICLYFRHDPDVELRARATTRITNTYFIILPFKSIDTLFVKVYVIVNLRGIRSIFADVTRNPS